MLPHVPPQFEQRLLALINSHGWDHGSFAAEPLRFLSAWIKAEGGAAACNPLNCTLFVYGATVYNTFVVDGVTFHVWNYLHAVDGIAATGITLVNGHYNGILGDLQNGSKTAEQITRDRWSQIATWGTNPQTILDVLASS
jgi:hypothetical protein